LEIDFISHLTSALVPAATLVHRRHSAVRLTHIGYASLYDGYMRNKKHFAEMFCRCFCLILHETTFKHFW